MKRPGAIAFTAALLSLMSLPAQSALDETPQPLTPEAQHQIEDCSRLAHEAAQRNDLEEADKFYYKLLIVAAPVSAKERALEDMFENYRTRHVYSKAITVGEKLRELFPADPSSPDLLLKLGLLYRETGAYQLAISRFYNVLNSVLRIDQAEFSQYKNFSTKAQFEIAETFMEAGDYQQARKTYSLLDRLDLEPDDKARTQFKLTYCQFLLGDYAATVTAARRFFEKFGETPSAPECHYVLSVALRALKRSQEAADEVLTLLRTENAKRKSDAKAWSYWQKKTGNQIANEFYQQGDFPRALTIYQALAKLNNEPGWQWPVIYQMGLCFERLRLPERALEAYKYILDESKKKENGVTAMDSDLAEICKMSQWRTDHVAWQQNTESQLDLLLGPKSLPEDVKVTSTP